MSPPRTAMVCRTSTSCMSGRGSKTRREAMPTGTRTLPASISGSIELPTLLQLVLGENDEKADSSPAPLGSHGRVRCRGTCTARGRPDAEFGPPLPRRANFPGRCAQGTRRHHQEKGEREQRVGWSALGRVLCERRRDEDVLCLRGAQRGGGPQGGRTQQTACRQ